jgi:Tat protein translocase TatB subunit
MPSIGPAEMLMVAVIALIAFGPQRLPEIARTVGKTLAELKRQASDLRSEFESGMDDDPPEDEKPAPEDEKP